MKQKYFKRNLKLTLGLATFFLVLTGAYNLFKHKTDLTDATVMILRMDQRGGGTGVILSSSDMESYILTNDHVCEVVKFGGIVVTKDKAEHLVTSYRESTLHDVCLLKVSTNLKVNTNVSTTLPNAYEDAVVSGHPNLLPNVLTRGHFSTKTMVDVLVGYRDCDPEDLQSKDLAMFCALVGKAPIIRKYESVLVSALIMPGSSGSGVYNANEQLSGLVFAGSAGLSYGFIVPLEYITNFLNKEYRTAEEHVPSYLNKFNSNSNSDDNKKNNEVITSDDSKFLEVCSAMQENENSLCEIIKRDIRWRM